MMRLLLSATAGWASWSRAGAGLRLRARRRRHRARPRRLRAATTASVDVAIDFTVADAVPHNLPLLAARGINVVIGTTGWRRTSPRCEAWSPAPASACSRGELLARDEPVPAGRRGGRAPLRPQRTSAHGSTSCITPPRRTRRRAPRCSCKPAWSGAATPAPSTYPRRAPVRFPARTPSDSTGPRRRSP